MTMPHRPTQMRLARRTVLVALTTAVAVVGAPPALAQGNVVGHVYMQTNETENKVMHFGRRADGTLTLIETVATGGAGSGVFKPVSGQAAAPNAFEGASSVILTEGNRFLFVTNGGDNSVTSFSVAADGRLTRIDQQATGEPVTGKSGTAKSLAWNPRARMLYVLHSFGPNHLRAFHVNGGKMTLTAAKYTTNTGTKTDRIPTQVVLSPDGKWLLVDNLFDFRPAANPDGTPKLIVSNAPDPDGLAIFPVNADGTLGAPRFADAGGGGPFYIAFLHGSNDMFLNGTAVGDGLVLSKLNPDGSVTNGPLVPIDTKLGKPSELCWLQITRDNRVILATNFGYSNVSSYKLENGRLSLFKDPASAEVPGDGKFRAVNNRVSSGPSDSWLTPDDRYFHQIYGNASVLVSYRLNKEDGSLTEIGRQNIPYDSPEGLAGF